MTATRLHRLNASFLGLFILLHMATHVSGLWGIETYNATQKVLRAVYRTPLTEPLVLASGAIQLALGLKLLLGRWRRAWRDVWGRTQALSGVVFFLFLSEHLAALVLARWIDGLDTNFFWPASVMSGAPFTWYFVPYYFFGVAALFVHLACAARLILLRAGRHRIAVPAFFGIAFAGVLLSGLIVAILLGAFYDIALPAEWIDYLRRFVPDYAA